MAAASESQQTTEFGARPGNASSRAITPLSLWGGDTLVYKSIIALATASLPLVALANWYARGTPWGSQLVVAAALLAGAVVCQLLSNRGMRDTAGALLIGVIWSAATIFAFSTGFGLHSSVIYLYLPCILYTVLFFGVTMAGIELALTIAALLLMYWAEARGTIGGMRAFAEQSSNFSFLIGIVVTCIGTFAVGMAYHRRVASEAGRVLSEAAERHVAMEQAQLAQAQLETANAKLQSLNAELAAQTRQHQQDTVRARRDIDLYHDVVSKDFPASLAQLLAALARPDEGTEARLQREIARMASVVDALGALGRQSEPPLQRVPVDLTALAHEAAAHARTRYPRMRIDIDAGLRADGDGQMLGALLRHLVKRACSACRAESEPLVHVGAGSREGRAVFYVSDNGPGMDTAAAQRMFRPFERGAEENTVDIGLVSARRIAERHGGELSVESSPRGGTTFFFTLAG